MIPDIKCFGKTITTVEVSSSIVSSVISLDYFLFCIVLKHPKETISLIPPQISNLAYLWLLKKSRITKTSLGTGIFSGFPRNRKEGEHKLIYSYLYCEAVVRER